jgi:hypothetical protein
VAETLHMAGKTLSPKGDIPGLMQALLSAGGKMPAHLLDLLPRQLVMTQH